VHPLFNQCKDAVEFGQLAEKHFPTRMHSANYRSINRLGGCFILNCHKNCLVFVTMIIQFEPQSAMSSDLGVGLRSASGESGVEAERSVLRIAAGTERPAAEPQTEARRSCGPASCKLVTSARFAKRQGRRCEAYERRAALEAKQTARWSRRISGNRFPDFFNSITAHPRLSPRSLKSPH
jgi:hypothetical protein